MDFWEILESWFTQSIFYEFGKLLVISIAK